MSRISLWDNNFDLIAAEDGITSVSGANVTINGDGPIYHYLAHHHHPDGIDLNMTIDNHPDLCGRINTRVTSYTLNRRQCECGESTITTTTIQGHRFR